MEWAGPGRRLQTMFETVVASAAERERGLTTPGDLKQTVRLRKLASFAAPGLISACTASRKRIPTERRMSTRFPVDLRGSVLDTRGPEC